MGHTLTMQSLGGKLALWRPSIKDKGDFFVNFSETLYINGLMDELEKEYEFFGVMQVRSFIDDDSLLMKQLLEAKKLLNKHFGKTVNANLEVVTDPETGKEKELFIQVITELETIEALQKLNQIYDDGTLGNDLLKKKVIIDVVFN